VIILLIVLLGVASAQLAAVLERRREFAVLSALGMSTGRMVRLVLEEALAVGLIGAAVGAGIGLPVVWRFAHAGLDLRRYLGANYTFQGVLIEPVLYGDVGLWIAPYVFVVAIGVTMLASLYPAWFASRTDPAVALRVAQ
jgi:ABC-type antimicrobial peptide transport system permease subunit